MVKFPQGKPNNYDKSFAWLNEKGVSHEVPKLGLDSIKDFGSAQSKALKENRINTIMGVNGVMTAWQTERPDNPEAMPLPLGHTPSDFQTKQIPNTKPKFDPVNDLRAHDEQVKKSSKSMIWHGNNPATKKGI